MATRATNNENKKYIQLIIAVLIITAIIFASFSQAAAEDEQIQLQPTIRLAAGFSHSAMVDYDGSLYLWGDNTYGQSSAGSDSYIDQPQLIELNAKVAEVSLGAWHTLVLTENGEVYSSGRNTFGQLGNGSWENSDQLVKIEGLSNIAAISAGSYHSLALGQDGSLWVWGSNTNNQLAHADSEELKENDQIVARRSSSPEKIIDSGVSQIAAGGHFSLYADQDGKIFAFGDNSKGQLGVGTTENSDLPIQVADIENAVRIEAGYEYALAIIQTDSEQKLYSWGDNSLGQLGIGQPGGAGAMRTRPAEVKLPAEFADYDVDLMNIDQLSAGYSHVLMTMPEQVFFDDPETKTRLSSLSGYQHLLSWGSNAFGQLGSSPSTQIYLQPNLTTVAAETGATLAFVPFDAVAAGGSHSLVMSSLGQLAASGRGNQGQLGTVSIIDRSSYTAVETKDHILPAWTENQYVSAEFNEDNELHINWQPAQNNRSKTMYRLEIKTEDGKRQLLECDEQTSRTILHLVPSTPLAITVYAYDEASETLPNDQLSLLNGAYLPEDYDINLWSETFDQPLSGATQKMTVKQNWTADPSGLLPVPAVPWKQTVAYDTRVELTVPQSEVPLANIVIMILATLLIIAAAIWIAINFHKERSLIYPLKMPTKIKTSGRRMKSLLSDTTTKIIYKTKKSVDRLKLKFKKDTSLPETDKEANEEETPADKSAEVSEDNK